MNTNKDVWILEDDPGCVFVYQEILDIRYRTRYFCGLKTFATAFADPDQDRPHLLIADLRLSDGNFVSLLDGEMGQELNLPFIVISSLDDIDVLRHCLKRGAVDFLTKPFKKNELIVKVERIMADFFILEGSDEKKLKAVNDTALKGLQKEIPGLKKLTEKEAQIVSLFLNAKKHTMNREFLVDSLWEGAHVHPKTVDVHIYNLRKKLQPMGLHIKCKGIGQWTLMVEGQGPDFQLQ